MFHVPMGFDQFARFNRVMLSPVILAGLISLFALTAPTPAQGDWPQWRGPSRDGLVNLPWPDSVSEDVLVEEQSIPLQPSYSGPIVVADRVFVTETQDKKNEVVTAFEVSTGKKLWSTGWEGSMRVPFFAASNGSWIRATPAYDDGRLYVAGIRDVLVCLDARTGDTIWKRDSPNETQSSVPSFGFVCSPLIEGDFLFVQAGGGLQKLDKRTGKTIWKVLDDGGGMSGSAFSSPYLATIVGRPQLIVQTRKTLHGVDPNHGTILWSQDIPAFRGMNILTPTVFKNSIFVSTYGGTTQALSLTPAGNKFDVKQKWNVGLQGYMTSPVVIDGFAYWRLKNQRFACINLETGNIQWRSKPFGKYASLIASGNKILALDETGTLMLLRANAEEFELIDKRKVGDDTWAHLAVTQDRLFIRDLRALKIYRWKR
jgi:outer membrane protein assembly factor BamB